MHEAATEYLARWPWKAQAGVRMLTESELQDQMLHAYLAGYEAGRASTTRAKAPA